jgi:argininosuccinate synthase
VRFEAAIKALAPEIKIIAPWRTWELKSREDCIDYAKKHQIPIAVTKKSIYSRDENLFHISHEGGELEDPWSVHTQKVYMWCTPPEKGPAFPEEIMIEFEKGIPTKINSKTFEADQMLSYLNEVGSKHGVGIIDIVENRLVGMKSRGVYETPGGTILYDAYKGLEKLVLDRQTMSFKTMVAQKYAELLYDGLWFSKLKDSLDGFIEKTQILMTGIVKLKLYKGSCQVVSTFSPYSLYSEEFVTFGEDDVYNQQDAEGFINLFTLPLKINAMMEDEKSLSKVTYQSYTPYKETKHEHAI